MSGDRHAGYAELAVFDRWLLRIFVVYHCVARINLTEIMDKEHFNNMVNIDSFKHTFTYPHSSQADFWMLSRVSSMVRMNSGTSNGLVM